MRRNPERLAWTVLLVSLVACISITVLVPLSVYRFVNNSTDTATITLEVQQGTALVRRPDTVDPIGVTTALNALSEGTAIQADENVQGLLTIRSPRDGTVLQTVQIYGNTTLAIEEARSPRFEISTLPYQLQLKIDQGRVRVTLAGSTEQATLADSTDRAIQSEMVTPQANTKLTEGSYSFDVTNDETQVTVREGQAHVSAQGTILDLNPLQRTVVKLGSRPAGILSPERNLVTNGSFRLPLEGTWEIYNDLQNPEERPGEVSVVTSGGQRAALIERFGDYHAETGIRQVINRDVRDFRSLKLHFVVTVSAQDVPVCGQAGSECPMMLRLDYKDGDGTDRSYLQGFYSVSDNVNPNYNTTSGSRNEHIRVPLNFAYTYDTGNLMETLMPSQITAITFYSSGHTYRASVAEIELLGEQ
jgi:hypothetical protein